MIIVADTGAILALMDRRDRHHAAMTACFTSLDGRWVLPWAILPEVDYLLARELGVKVHDAWLTDLREGLWDVEPMAPLDLAAAALLHQRYRSLRLGLVDAVVAITAERLQADAIATVDLKHFGAISLPRAPKLLPRDLDADK